MKAFPRNRYPARALLSAFEHAGARMDGENCLMVLDAGEEASIELYFPAQNGECGEPWRSKARAVLADLARLDNLVQESCESEWARSNQPPEQYELYLAAIELGPSGLGLVYYGEKVNTEWEAQFRLRDGRWEKDNF